MPSGGKLPQLLGERADGAGHGNDLAGESHGLDCLAALEGVHSPAHVRAKLVQVGAKVAANVVGKRIDVDRRVHQK